jgi:hypothetical protein
MPKLTIRKSQVVNAYGAGNIVDFPGLSLMILSPDAQANKDNPNNSSWGYERNLDKLRKVYDNRLATLLNVDYFVSPPLVKEDNDTPAYPAINSIRFPGTLFCPHCMSIQFVSRIELQPSARDFDYKNESFFCTNQGCNRVKLVPMRFVIATSYGHIDDFPWDWYCHKNNRGNRGVCASQTQNQHLKLRLGNSASISDLSVYCTKCNSEQSLGGIFNQESTFMDPDDPYLQRGSRLRMPWLGKIGQANRQLEYKYENAYNNHPRRNDIFNPANLRNQDLREKLKNFYPVTLQRGAGNIYFPITHRGISLPTNIATNNQDDEPNKRIEADALRMIEIISNLPNFGEDLDPNENNLGNLISRILLFITNDQDFKDAYDIGERIKIRGYLQRYIDQMNNKGFQPEIIEESIKTRKEEYDCFLNPNIEESRYYKSEIKEGNAYLGLENIIEKVVLLHKLKQLNIHIGFTRVRPLAIDELKFIPGTDKAGSYEEEYRRIKHIRSRTETSWLPAVEVMGEGIFIQFRQDKLDEWLQNHDEKIIARMNILSANYKRSLIQFGVINDAMEAPRVDPRYVLLHTLSHLLLEALSMNSGYNAASLAEIIYSDKGSDSIRMDGILIYTSTSDAEGTLGGLVAMGQPGKLEELFKSALEKSEWCSSDPLCIGQEFGQGFMGLNMAACHACCMLPESSCENINKFLDRGLLIGTLENPEIGFLKNLFSDQQIIT